MTSYVRHTGGPNSTGNLGPYEVCHKVLNFGLRSTCSYIYTRICPRCVCMQERVRPGNLDDCKARCRRAALHPRRRTTTKKKKRRRRKQQQQQQAGSHRCVVMTAARRAADGSLEYHGSIAKPHFSRNWKDYATAGALFSLECPGAW
ncbi:uncharacterized protein LOC122574403 isoform X2 [Bombus pyrosoma]|uniref:uncharacterized protein LOC122574403 isoform X2 n=1 Tax=Bombus pyrosoma TaxID=396416 RepID=UPI001CB90C3E|nr:uncharacterized protein LOC122574403 isoform X2 [Bombus pyrosoma]